MDGEITPPDITDASGFDIADVKNKVEEHGTEIILLKAALSNALSRLEFVEGELKKSNGKLRKDKNVPKLDVAETKKVRPSSETAATISSALFDNKRC